MPMRKATESVALRGRVYPTAREEREWGGQQRNNHENGVGTTHRRIRYHTLATRGSDSAHCVRKKFAVRSTYCVAIQTDLRRSL